MWALLLPGWGEIRGARRLPGLQDGAHVGALEAGARAVIAKHAAASDRGARRDVLRAAQRWEKGWMSQQAAQAGGMGAVRRPEGPVAAAPLGSASRQRLSAHQRTHEDVRDGLASGDARAAEARVRDADGGAGGAALRGEQRSG